MMSRRDLAQVTKLTLFAKYLLPRLGDKPSFQSSYVPPPSFKSLSALPTATARRQCLRAGRLVRAERLELPTFSV